jgi:hypothetical protein
MSSFTTLSYPCHTGGGPCHPDKGPNKLENMKSFWMNVYEHGSTHKSLLILQAHKATYKIISIGTNMFAGKNALQEMRDIRQRQGDLDYRNPYRVIIAEPPNYATVASSDNWEIIVAEFEKLRAVEHKLLQEYTRPEAAKRMIRWTIEQKIQELVKLAQDDPNDESKKVDLKTLLFELNNLQGISPVSLANMEREHVRIITYLIYYN